MREWAGGETGTGVADGAHGAASAGGAEGAPFGEYCPYTKAAEYLGDRWVLLIVRGLAVFGPQGFNALAAALPGVSRSVLARRLRALEALGLLARAPGAGAPAPYRLAPAGEQLVPTLLALHRWAERWVPEDSALARRDPAVLTWWLAQRVDPGAVPAGPVVLAFDIRGPRPQRVWLVLERGAPPSGCLEDPGLAPERYVYVEADGEALDPLARGRRAWGAALADGSVRSTASRRSSGRCRTGSGRRGPPRPPRPGRWPRRRTAPRGSPVGGSGCDASLSLSSPRQAAEGSAASGGRLQQACHWRQTRRTRWRLSARRASRAVRPACCRRAR